MRLNHTYYILGNPTSNIKNNLAHGYYNNGTDMNESLDNKLNDDDISNKPYHQIGYVL